ncbi:hypothetical protein [Streptomyces olivochromogenes]|uniref:hypothetical protein n=1 Tax=Streptomyces olivochromogenes TaxID=1963 RepID=UPI001F3A7DF9|nr:hypothetical protein [Streptomyces olivochromogenes]MCF3136283.1 hypothetical protein [Streptomyces olivochromogenes]
MQDCEETVPAPPGVEGGSHHLRSQVCESLGVQLVVSLSDLVTITTYPLMMPKTLAWKQEREMTFSKASGGRTR